MSSQIMYTIFKFPHYIIIKHIVNVCANTLLKFFREPRKPYIFYDLQIFNKQSNRHNVTQDSPRVCAVYDVCH